MASEKASLKGFFFPWKEKIKINEIWFPFAARGMLQGVEVGYHQPGAKLACSRSRDGVLALVFFVPTDVVVWVMV